MGGPQNLHSYLNVGRVFSCQTTATCPSAARLNATRGQQGHIEAATLRMRTDEHGLATRLTDEQHQQRLKRMYMLRSRRRPSRLMMLRFCPGHKVKVEVHFGKQDL